MHSNIYQISTSHIDKEDYASPSKYEDNSDDFADYIGDAREDEERESAIRGFAELVKDVFTMQEPGVFVYKGKKALREFKQKWIDDLRQKVQEMTPENMFKEQRLFRLSSATKETHLDASSRVDIKEWTGNCAYPLGELFEWANSQLKDGDKFYIGAVIGYHW